MINDTIELKLKIDQFRSNFLAKDGAIIFEENKFDLFIGILFNVTKKTLLPIINFLLRSIMNTIDKFLDFITQQKELKKKILKQEEILFNNTKINSILSEQISELNTKIDKISLNKPSSLEVEGNDKILNKNNTEINQVPDVKIEQVSNHEVDFYQKENLRISNQLFETQKKFEIMKMEIEKFQSQRSNLIDKINSVNDVIQDSNIVTNVFENQNQEQELNPPPTYMPSQKTRILLYAILLLLDLLILCQLYLKLKFYPVINLKLNRFLAKTEINLNSYIIMIVIIKTIIDFIMFMKLYTYNACSYNLPLSWNI